MTTTTLTAPAPKAATITLGRALALFALIAIAVLAFTIGRVTSGGTHTVHVPAVSSTPAHPIHIEHCRPGRPC